jgi:hypothetical protein
VSNGQDAGSQDAGGEGLHPPGTVHQV